MKQQRNLKGLFEILLVIAAILLIPLFFAIGSQAAQGAATPTMVWPSPSPIGAAAQVVVASPTAIPPTSVARGKQPPACTFPLAQITAGEPKPENYTFSEPKVVLTDPQNVYDIVEWLPDNQQVLITQDQRSTRKMESDKFLRQSIQLYNPTTGKSKIYAIRHHTDEPPIWQPGLNAVVYPDANILGTDEINHRFKFTRQVWVSRGDPKTTQMLADNLSQFSVAVKSDGSQTAYLPNNKIYKSNGLLQGVASTPFNLNEWDYSKTRNEFPVSYLMIWQPGTSLIFLYSSGDFEGGYTFILDSNTGQVCELNLGGWAARAHWSSNGRYLAIARFQGIRPTASSDLVVLDAVTGKLYTMVVTAQDAKGNHYVTDLAWAPDNHHILVTGGILSLQGTKWVGSRGLYLVNFIAGRSDPLLTKYSFPTASSSSSNLAWSPDGSKLLVRCPTNEEERVCFISVQRIRK